MKKRLGKKRSLSTHQKSLLRRIERISRTASLFRLRGNIVKANQYERTLNSLFNEAESNNLASAATKREEAGHHRADRLYRKAGGRRK